ncbi:MAG: N-acetyltransferase [Peptococcaceae bacterium]|nr:N-acetyltransferase [Peptococcaceae bacterium]
MNTQFISIDKDNIEREHICCAISDKRGETGVASKKAWMKNAFADGLVFQRLDERGKVFLEYIPAGNAWYPISAEGYMHINCLWVSGQYQGKGHADRLLQGCVEDAKGQGKHGLTTIASEKKRSFLTDPGYLKHKGFMAADTAEPYFVLYYMPFAEDAPVPKIKDCAKQGHINEKGMVLYYTNQCPHTDKYAPLLREMAEQRGAAVKLVKLETKEQAQNAPGPFTTYSFFNDGKFVAHEIMGPAAFGKFMDKSGL